MNVSRLWFTWSLLPSCMPCSTRVVVTSYTNIHMAPPHGTCPAWLVLPIFLEYDAYEEISVSMDRRRPMGSPYRNQPAFSATPTRSCSSCLRSAVDVVVNAVAFNPAEDFDISSALVEWHVKPRSILKHSARPSCVGYLNSYNKMVTLAMTK